jgi:branched-chain amino acid transport system substrate-binding protein
MRRATARFAASVAMVAMLVALVVPDAGAATKPKKASGEPVTFGFINQEDSPLGSFTEYRIGAEAAVDYVNKQLDGLHGRPIELDQCITKGSPESTTGCANQILEKDPVALLGGVDVLAIVAAPIFEAAKVPILGGAALTPPEHSSPVGVRFNGWSLTGPPLMAEYAAKQLEAKNVVLVFPENPASRPVVDLFIKPVLKKAGVKFTEAAGTADQTDWTPVLSAAAAQNPDAIISVADANQCIGIMKARQSLAIKAPLLMVAACNAPDLLKDAGPAAEGVYFGQMHPPVTSKSKDVETFKKMMKKYAPKGTPLTEITQDGFASVMNVWEVLNKAPAASLDSSDDVLAAFKATKNEHNFMGHPYTCDGAQVPNAPSVCNADGRMVQVKKGVLVDIGKKWFDAASQLG